MPTEIEICSRSQAMSDVETRIRSRAFKGPGRTHSDQSSNLDLRGYFYVASQAGSSFRLFMKKDGRLQSVHDIAKAT